MLFNLAKLFSLIALGFLFLTWFETVAWAVLIAVIIPWVDIWSVFFGPTEKVTEDHPSVFNDVAIEFAVPGSAEGARIGPPDILFFALFLAAAARFGLRVAWTWIGMTAMLSATLIVVVDHRRRRPPRAARDLHRLPGPERGSALARAAPGRARTGADLRQDGHELLRPRRRRDRAQGRRRSSSSPATGRR